MLASILRDSWGNGVGDLMDGLSFNYTPCKHVWEICKHVWVEQSPDTRKLPTIHEIRYAVVKAPAADVIYRNLVLETLDTLEAVEFTDFTRQIVQNRVTKLRAARVAASIQEAIDNNADLTELLPTWRKSLTESTHPAQQTGWFSLEEMDYIDKLYTDRLEALKGRTAIQTGIRRFDKRCIHGGVLPDDFIVLMGASGRGKSTLFQGFANRFAHQGLVVMMLTLEEGPLDVVARLEATVPHQAFTERGPGWRAEFEVRRRIAHPTGGHILLPRRPIPPGWKVRWLEGTVAAAEEEFGRRVDVVMIDHMEMISSDSQSKERHDLAYQAMCMEMRQYGIANTKLIVAATQGNRAGHYADVMTLTHVSEAYSKAWYATQFLAICMTKTQAKLKTFGLACLKNRQGKEGTNDYVMPLQIHYDKQDWTEPIGDEVEDFDEWVERVKRTSDG